MRKSQVSFFIVISVILVSVSVFLFLQTNTDKIEEIGDEEVLIDNLQSLSARESIERCMKDSIIESLVITFSRSGYFEIEGEDSLIENAIITKIYSPQTVENYPTLDTIKESILSFNEPLLEVCIKSIEENKDLSFNFESIDYKDSNTIVQFDRENIVVELELPVTVLSGEKKESYKNFYVKVPFQMEKIYSSIEFIMESHINSSNAIPLSEFEYLYFNESVDFEFYYINNSNDKILYELVFDSPFREGLNLSYFYAYSYNWTEVES